MATEGDRGCWMQRGAAGCSGAQRGTRCPPTLWSCCRSPRSWQSPACAPSLTRCPPSPGRSPERRFLTGMGKSLGWGGPGCGVPALQHAAAACSAGRHAFADSRLPGACGRLAGHGTLPLGRSASWDDAAAAAARLFPGGEQSPARRAEADVYGRDEPGAPAEAAGGSGLPAQGEACVRGQTRAGSTWLLPTHPGTGRAAQHPPRPGRARTIAPGQKAAGHSTS